MDGTLEGPDVEAYVSLLAATSLRVIASGGVGDLDHIRSLANVERDGRGLEGVIVGRAIYDGRFTVEDALAACTRG